MKYLITLLLCIPLFVQADQRFETAGGYSHFVLDPNNSDNEIYFSNCQSEIETISGAARGYTICEIDEHNGVPWEKYVTSCDTDGYKCVLVGDETTLNTSCNMVTSNYDAANDKWNQTEYVSNNWASRYVATKVEYGNYNIKYILRCYDGSAQ